MRKNALQLAAALCAMLLTLAACTDDALPAPSAPPDNDIDWIDILPEPEGAFELTEVEFAYYEKFIRTGDISVLYGVDPFSVIRISLQAAVDGNIEHEFSLFHPDTLDGLTLESYLAANNPETAGGPEFLQRMADLFFSQMDQGEFTRDGDRAWVSFYTELGEPLTLSARQNDDGIWLVEFSW